MTRKNKLLFFSILIGLVGAALVVTRTAVLRGAQSVLGDISEPVPTSPASSDQTHFNTVLSPVGTTSEPSPTRPPVPDRFDISLVSGPAEIIQHANASFTWQISGPSRTIHTTTIYSGTVSTPGTLSTTTEPGATKYTESVKDFMNGNFFVPLRYIGNSIVSTPGTYYYRAYAFIDGKHYWSDERVFVVKPEPRHEIKIVNPPSTLRAGDNAAFTWDVYGPSATMWFTVIVASKESKPETLDESVDLPKTPYAIMVNEFTTGPYTVPLRFIGNAKMTEPGVYYFRALALINGKNIWSDEYSLTVQ